MRHKVLILSAIVLLATAVAARAQEDIEKLPGYVDFKALGIADGREATVEVFLKGSLLRLLATATANDEDEPGLSDVLSKLAAIRVETYSLRDYPGDEYEKQVVAIGKRLESQGWETIVKVREPDSKAHIAIKTQGDRVVGLMVMAWEKNDEVAFVNIVGDIDLDRIGKLGDEFHVKSLDSLHWQSHSSAKDKSH